MRRFALLAISLGLLAGQVAQAAVVVAEREENLVGGGFGGLTGLMVGAVGGPVGAVVGAAAGWWSGAQLQRVTGLSGTDYQVRHDDGREQWVRSPRARFTFGESVEVERGRLRHH